MNYSFSLCFPAHFQHGNLGGVIERRGIYRWLADDGLRVTGDIFGNRDYFFKLKIAIRSQFFQLMDVIHAAKEKRIVDGDQPAAIPDQRAHLVDQAIGLVLEVHPAAPAVVEKKGASRMTQSNCRAFAAHGAHGREEIPAEEILAVDGEMIERVGPPRDVEELATAIELDHALRTACQGGGTQAAGIGEGVEHVPAGGVIFEPGAQVAGIDVEAGVLVEGEIQRVVYPVLQN